jgi:hypothetical protein
MLFIFFGEHAMGRGLGCLCFNPARFAARGGRWGDLVAAACSGARLDRVVWLDVLAVRQWPGNAKDLDFRGVIARCTAVVVGVAPLEGAVAKGELRSDGFNGKKFVAAQDEYLASDEYKAAAKVLAFARLWCIGELRSRSLTLCYDFVDNLYLLILS